MQRFSFYVYCTNERDSCVVDLDGLVSLAGFFWQQHVPISLQRFIKKNKPSSLPSGLIESVSGARDTYRLLVSRESLRPKVVLSSLLRLEPLPELLANQRVTRRLLAATYSTIKGCLLFDIKTTMSPLELHSALPTRFAASRSSGWHLSSDPFHSRKDGLVRVVRGLQKVRYDTFAALAPLTPSCFICANGPRSEYQYYEMLFVISKSCGL